MRGRYASTLNRPRLDTPLPKRIKKDSLSRSYAAIIQSADAIIQSADDDISLERNKELLKECSRAKPKSEVIRELIKRTLKER